MGGIEIDLFMNPVEWVQNQLDDTTCSSSCNCSCNCNGSIEPFDDSSLVD